MPKYVAILKDKKKGKLTNKLLSEHVEHLRKLAKNHMLYICGPFTNDEKAIQILLCESIEEATKLVESDPFIMEGYYGAYELNELIEANEENNWLMEIPQTKNNLSIK